MKLSPVDAWHPASRYGAALSLCAVCALGCLPLLGRLDLANIAMLFLLTVAVTAAWLGQGPAVVAAFVSVALFDWLFVEPRFSFAVHDGQYIVTFLVMLVVALLVSHLSAQLRRQLADSREREERTQILYECARRMAGAMTREQIDETLHFCLSEALSAQAVALYLPDAAERIDYRESSGRSSPSITERRVIQLCYDTGRRQDSDEISAAGMCTVYLPLRGATRMRGVLAIGLPQGRAAQANRNGLFLEALASLLATALERLHFVTVAQVAELEMRSERLRNTILASISHDVRTPLTVICGLADTLSLVQPGLSAESRELVDTLRTHAFRLHRMVENLLDLARLQSGAVNLRREWQPLEEVVGASIHMLGSALSSHTVRVSAPSDPPLLQFDAVLIERVFANLLENAAKYSTQDSVITLDAAVRGDVVEVQIRNTGSLFPDNANQELLYPFSRGGNLPSTAGFGIGLPICRSIIEAHGGTIELRNPGDSSACVLFTLPRGMPPAVDPEDAVGGLQS